MCKQTLSNRGHGRMKVDGSGSTCGGGCVGERVYVRWWGVVCASFVEIVLKSKSKLHYNNIGKLDLLLSNGHHCYAI
jgi:hypothetical protein